MKTSRLSLLIAMIVLLSVTSFAARRVSTSGSFFLEDPIWVNTVSFQVYVQNLPTNGGATISPWVEFSCPSYEGLEAAIMPVVSGTSNPTRAIFQLTAEQTAMIVGQSCEAYLFYDGWNGPRRRKGNTLGALFFTVTP